MNINDILPPEGIDALAGQLGVSHDEARRGAEALLPSIVAGMGTQTAAPNGGEAASGVGLEGLIGQLGGAQLADNVVGPAPTEVSQGNALLGQILGSKDVSRQVAGNAAQTTGLDPALLKKMLPIVAMLAAGFLAKRSAGQQGGLGGILASVLGSMGGAAGGAGSAIPGGLGGILGSVLGGGPR